ncbi:oxygenase MpaB family protein [Streptomyces sp. NPDC020707]|uniref:oxygenase MpaB family protein n=1 Tax=Streptomyces sp. NPDC020707 TaxID=3365084 RepID=UPI00378C1C95
MRLRPFVRSDGWGRLLRTVDFVGVTTYGTTEAAEKAGARVRGIHKKLTATHPGTGERYGVDEPALLLWVHCAEVDSRLHVLRRSGLRLTEAQADRYIDENRAGARLVGLDPAHVPSDQRVLAAYFEKTRPELTVGPEAREAEDFLRRPPVHPLLVPARALLWRWVAQTAYASLPPRAHELYGRSVRSPRAVTRRLRLTGTVPRCVPARLRRRLPPKHVIRAMSRLGPGSRPAPYKVGP